MQRPLISMYRSCTLVAYLNVWAVIAECEHVSPNVAAVLLCAELARLATLPKPKLWRLYAEWDFAWRCFAQSWNATTICPT